MVKPEYPDEEEFSTSDGKSIEEEEGVDGMDGWRTVSIRNFKVKSSDDGSSAAVDRQRERHNRFVDNVDQLLVIDTGKECGLHSCTSTNSSSNESSLHLSSGNHHDAKIVMLHSDGTDDKRIRRQIANSNERRRMQSINHGFQSLRHLLPNRKDGDKMSKAAILSATADFIQTLQVEKIRLEEVLQHEESELAAQAKRQRLDCHHQQPPEELMEVGDGCSPSAPSAHSTSIPASLQSSIFECLHTIDELRTALAKEQQLRAVLEQELMAVRKNSGVEQSSLLAICQQPQPQLSSTQALMFNGAYSAGMQQQQQQMSSMGSPQQSSLIASALTSAFTTLRDVFGSKMPTAEDHHHLSPIPAPIPNRQSDSSLLFNRLESSSLAEGQHLLLTQAPSDMKHSRMHDCHVSNQTDMSVERGLSQSGDGLSVSQRNLQAILEAIRHLEGGEAVHAKN